MSSGNIQQETLHEELDAAIKDNAPKGKLEDAEIQRLVQLSNDASYQRSERVPVKTFEAGLQERTVVIEFDSTDAAIRCYENPDYQKLLPGLGVLRDMRVIEGV